MVILKRDQPTKCSPQYFIYRVLNFVITYICVPLMDHTRVISNACFPEIFSYKVIAILRTPLLRKGISSRVRLNCALTVMTVHASVYGRYIWGINTGLQATPWM